ncbi:MBL fold metallo-hydrolase [Christiangramia fulva]|uniref:MBL fold metallo-hydrolase n=2 Tax=Christiangramia fulva TaxID=2126553 RepID=A0A2R3Z6V1_9FLAO|nr:MBL fold metallo-hydrolase [Christiangramia fulva]AVR45985.1 MBL fold metallo-hydrolase [Christiangramia fulva]
MKKLNIQFLGAAGTVTGSKFLVETDHLNILIDCGFFQGLKELRLKNWEDLPVNVSKIDYVLLTHGHLDHTGYLPRLISQGFKGVILGNAPTLEIAEIILKDTARIQEEEAEKANKEGFSKHHPALPLYTLKDAEETLTFFRIFQSGEWNELGEKVKFRHRLGGHILGAGFIELEVDGKLLLFSGDLGRQEDLLLNAPEKPEWADFLFLESTYGDRLHPEENVEKILGDNIRDMIYENGIMLIACFAVERLQLISYLLWKMFQKNQIPNVPIYIDSPMGVDVTELFGNFQHFHKVENSEFSAMKNHFELVSSYKRTWEIIDEQRPRIVLAGSGMLSGGRILTYLSKFIDKPNTRLVLTGYQAEGTRGRKIEEGAEEIKIWGKYYEVKAKLVKIESLSAHADQKELLDWSKNIKNIPEKVFLVHGEKNAATTLKSRLEVENNWKVRIPELYEKINLFP